MIRRITAGVLSVFLLLVFIMNSTAMAASVNGNGLRVSPVRTDLIIYPGHSSTVKMYVTNETKTSVTLEPIVNNFVASGQTGSPALILKDPNAPDPNGLRQFIAPLKKVTLLPNQVSVVNVVINIPKDISGGGYYGAIRFTPIQNKFSKGVSIIASVASIILVKVPGPQLHDQLNLSSFAVSQNNQASSFFFTGKGLVLIAKFQNIGNVQSVPFGKVSVQNMFGRVIMTKAINSVSPPGNVLPSSIRAFSVPLSHISSFGKYTVSGNFGYGSKGQLLSATTTFYVVAPWIIGLIVLVLLAIITLLWFMPKIFRAWYRRSLKRGKSQ